MSEKAVSFREICDGRYIPALDGLRAISVLTVFIYHFGFYSIPGDLGVSSFFVISGFLITWLLLKEFDSSGAISLGQFYVRRTIRIFPAYYAFLVFMYTQELLRGYAWPTELIMAGLFYVVNYYNALNGHAAGSSIAHAWSLGVEEQFYLLWPLVLIHLAKKGRQYCLNGLLISVAGVMLLRSFLYLGAGVSNSYVYNAFETRFDCLAVGCIIALVRDRPQSERVAAIMTRWSFLPLVTLGLLVLSRVGGSPAYHYSIGFTIDSVLLGVFMVQLVQLHKSFLWSWLELPGVRYVGKLSYSFYLYHVFGIGLGGRLDMLSPVIQFIVTLGLCIGIASLSYWIIEQPFLQLKHRLLAGGRIRNSTQ